MTAGKPIDRLAVHQRVGLVLGPLLAAALHST